MSIAFYPKLGAFLFGSESAATKAGLGVEPPTTTKSSELRQVEGLRR